MFGDCCAGLNALAAAQAFGATRIVITDVRDDNLPLAKKLGAKFPLLTPPSMSNEEAANTIKQLLPPDGPDCVIDCAGYQSTILVCSIRTVCKPHLLTCKHVLASENSIIEKPV